MMRPIPPIVFKMAEVHVDAALEDTDHPMPALLRDAMLRELVPCLLEQLKHNPMIVDAWEAAVRRRADRLRTVSKAPEGEGAS